MKKVIALIAFVSCCATTSLMAQGGGQRMTPEERMAMMKERLKPLGMTDVQTDSAIAALTDRSYMAGMNFREMSQEDRQAKMKEISELRQKRLEKSIGAELAKKVTELMSQRPGGGGGRPRS
ncbi:MAG: hypothetical protein KGO92_14180 [Bacteroidota bacterium]|jgi:tRNA G46 methylase TrmB|nr:hypothetical protein [Bacteroidota bacterium]